MKKVFIFVIIFFTGLAFGLLLSHGTLNAQGANEGADVMSKLDDIAKSQQELASTLITIKNDVQIIKVRVTQLQ